jgi:hypothetical protein
MSRPVERNPVSPEPGRGEERASFDDLVEIVKQSNGYAGRVIQQDNPMTDDPESIGLILPLSEADNTRCLVHFTGDSTTLPVTYVVHQTDNTLFDSNDPSITTPSTNIQTINYGPRESAIKRLSERLQFNIVWSSVNPSHRHHIANATTQALELAEDRLRASFTTRTVVENHLLTEATPRVRELRQRYFPQAGR